jgi:hypothetical protein
MSGVAGVEGLAADPLDRPVVTVRRRRRHGQRSCGLSLFRENALPVIVPRLGGQRDELPPRRTGKCARPCRRNATEAAYRRGDLAKRAELMQAWADLWRQSPPSRLGRRTRLKRKPPPRMRGGGWKWVARVDGGVGGVLRLSKAQPRKRGMNLSRASITAAALTALCPSCRADPAPTVHYAPAENLPAAICSGVNVKTKSRSPPPQLL